MIQNERIAPYVSVPASDLASELQHWRRSYPLGAMYKSGLRFERYAPTFEFGYDTFLLNQGKTQDELFPRLCHQYKDRVSACDRIDWAEAQTIIAATWERLRDSASRPVAIGRESPVAEQHNAAAAPAPRFHRWSWLPARPAFLHAASTAPRQAAAL